jgi:hypothetical protein
MNHPGHEAVDRIVTFFESLTPQSLERLHEVYDEQARFKDPFNEVQGLVPIAQVFRHMYRTLQDPRFVVTCRVCQDQHCMLTWDFLFGITALQARGTFTIRGATHLVLGADGRIVLHRDYWDAAEELYEKLPVLSVLMRWLKRRVNR